MELGMHVYHYPAVVEKDPLSGFFKDICNLNGPFIKKNIAFSFRKRGHFQPERANGPWPLACQTLDPVNKYLCI